MPVIIASGFTGTAQPLSHPRVGWRRWFGTPLFGGNAQDGFSGTNANNERTDSYWRPASLPATWELSPPLPPQQSSYVGIAAHTLGSSGCTVEVQTFVINDWFTIASVVPIDDEPLFFLFARALRSFMRVRITGGATMPLIGVIWMGDVTEWPRPAVYAPSVSFQRAKRSEFAANVTEGGQIIGRKLVRREMRPQMAVENLSEAWVASEFDAFARHAETLPFFVADRPAGYPASVAYAFSDADLVPERALPNAAVANSVTLEMRAYRAK